MSASQVAKLVAYSFHTLSCPALATPLFLTRYSCSAQSAWRFVDISVVASVEKVCFSYSPLRSFTPPFPLPCLHSFPLSSLPTLLSRLCIALSFSSSSASPHGCLVSFGASFGHVKRIWGNAFQMPKCQKTSHKHSHAHSQRLLSHPVLLPLPLLGIATYNVFELHSSSGKENRAGQHKI